MKDFKYIRKFSQIDKDDIATVGGKGANLGELTEAGLPVPDGFALTSQAYFYFIKKNNLKDKINQELKQVNPQDPHSYQGVSSNISKLIVRADVPDIIVKEVFSAYEELSGLFRGQLVAVRSSATAEDLPGASFAGQQATFLNVKGEASLIQKTRECWASLFTPRAIFYRNEKKFDHLKVGISVIVQKMVQSDSSGIMFTVNPVTNEKKAIIIEAIYGLGELIVQGAVTPDHYEVDRQTFEILRKDIGKQDKEMIRKDGKNIEQKVADKIADKQKISDEQIKELARFGKKIHQHYFFPQDIEWAMEKGKVYIVQSRPVTTIDNKQQVTSNKKQDNKKTKSLKLIIKGDPASPGIGSGYVRLIHSHKEIGKVRSGEVLVTEMTTPDFVPAMKKVTAIVTDKGGQTSHAAIVSRELGIPCVVGTEKATRILKSGKVITVNGKTGEVFEGSAADTGENKFSGLFSDKRAVFKEDTKNEFEVPRKTATKLYVNLAEPELAVNVASQNVDGVGLLRAEFIIAQIGIHPRKLLKDGRKDFFVDNLTEGIGKICQAFDPRPVVYRATDFKTNEYINLDGGKDYEPAESNPMLGYRGAYRYIADEQVFLMELDAIKKVRHKMNLSNLWLMIPFVRTVDELVKVKRIVTSHGLSRSNSFKFWMMAEIPANVILLDDFIDVGIDGISIGSNDLTMLTLGLDRDNESVAKEFDERNPAVLKSLEKLIKNCLKRDITCSICGQAPTIYPDLNEKLVSWGITSISVSPDAISSTRQLIYESEKKSCQKK